MENWSGWNEILERAWNAHTNLAFILVIHSPEVKICIWREISAPDRLISLMSTDLHETPSWMVYIKTPLSNTPSGFLFFFFSRLINGRLWKTQTLLCFTPKIQWPGFIWGMYSLWASCGTFLAALSFAPVCMFLPREWVLCKASTHSGYVGADQ